MGQNFENCDDVIDGWPLKKRTEHDMSHNALNSFMLIVLELVSVEVVSWFKLFFFDENVGKNHCTIWDFLSNFPI